MAGLAAGPSLFLRGHDLVLPGGGEGRGFRGLIWVEGRRAAGFLRLRDGYPTGGGGVPSATADRLWMVGLLREDEETEEEVLCFGQGGHGGGVIGCPVLCCYLCCSPLFGHAVAFLCACGQGFVLGVCGERATVIDTTSRSVAFGSGPASVCAQDADTDAGIGSLVRVGGIPATDNGKIRGSASVCVQDADTDTCIGSGARLVRDDSKISGSASGARARTPARGGGAGGRGRDRGVRGAPGGGRAPGRGATRTPEGEGRRAKRREATASASYKPPPREEEEAEGSLAVLPPERDGVNQDAAQVSENNDTLTNCYAEMVSVFQSVKKHVSTRKDLLAEADRRRDWSSVGVRVRRLQSQIDDLLCRYDTLSDLVATLRTQVRADGGYPVEQPPLLAAHPSSLCFRK